MEEYNHGVEEEVRPWTVMISFEFDYVFVSCVFIVKGLSMMRLDEIILGSSCKKCRNEAFIYVVYWCQVVDIKVRFAFDGRSNEFHRSTNQKGRNLSVLLCQFVDQYLHIGEWGV